MAAGKATAKTNNKLTPKNKHIMSLKTKQLNASLANGFTTEGLQKDGNNATFLATFSGVATATEAKLQQSIDGDIWSDIPGSEATIQVAQTEQMWNDDITPRGILLRLVVGPSANAQLVTIKLLSNE